MGLDSPWHWAILVLIGVALLGYKRLPEASRSLGRSLRLFRTELAGGTEPDKAAVEPAAPAAEVVTET